MDYKDEITLTRTGGFAPHVTPNGFEGNGYNAAYSTSGSWLNTGPLSLYASIKQPLVRYSNPETLVKVYPDASPSTTRLGLIVGADGKLSSEGAITLTSGANSQPLGRPGWKYIRRSPEISSGGLKCLPQGLLFLDSETIIFSVHLENTESRVYRININTGEVTGQFTFGGSYKHIAAFAKRSNGDIWTGDYETGSLLRLDIQASFNSGTAVILQTVNCSSLVGFGAIEFVTLNSVEYLLAGLFATTETDTYLYLFDTSKLSQASLVAADRYRRYLIGRRIQGIAMRNNKLIVSRNARYGLSGDVLGYIQEYNLPLMVTNLADDATVADVYNATTLSPTYVTGQWFGPSAYVEDIAIHPTSNDVYTCTEGYAVVGDYNGFLALWGSSLDVKGKSNDYLIDYDGVNSVSVKINNQLFDTLTWTLPTEGDKLAIGGMPNATPGFGNGFTWAFIKNVAVKSKAITDLELAKLTSGGYETKSLTAITVSLTNPGAELGNASGWTNEIGTLEVRNGWPIPASGTNYFTAGANLNTVARQRVEIGPQLTDTSLNWIKLRWKQSSYSDDDPGRMGIRLLDSADTVLDSMFSDTAWTLGGVAYTGPWFWYPRSLSVGDHASATKLDVVYDAAGRTSATNNDFFVDDVEVVIYVKAPDDVITYNGQIVVHEGQLVVNR